MGIRVKALSAGFANGTRIRPGQEFTLADDVKPGHWLQVIGADGKPKTKKELAADSRKNADEEAKKKADSEAKQSLELRGLVPADSPAGQEEIADEKAK